jgi:hypothetical protein
MCARKVEGGDTAYMASIRTGHGRGRPRRAESNSQLAYRHGKISAATWDSFVAATERCRLVQGAPEDALDVGSRGSLLRRPTRDAGGDEEVGIDGRELRRRAVRTQSRPCVPSHRMRPVRDPHPDRGQKNQRLARPCAACSRVHCP